MAIYASDILNPSKEQRNKSLYGDYGYDPNGNNENGAILRRLSQGAGWQAAQGIGFQNQLEPNRQGAITGLVNASNPSNMIAQAQGAGQGAMSQGMQAGQGAANQLAQQGFGAGAQGGAIQGGANAGTHAANALLFQANSPQAQMQALQQMLGAISQAPGSGLEQLLQMFQPIETRQQANYAQHQQGGLSGLAGLLGQGLGAWATGGLSDGAQFAGGNPNLQWLNGVRM